MHPFISYFYQEHQIFFVQANHFLVVTFFETEMKQRESVYKRCCLLYKHLLILQNSSVILQDLSVLSDCFSTCDVSKYSSE